MTLAKQQIDCGVSPKRTVLFLCQRAGRGAVDDESYCGIGIRGVLTGGILERGGSRYKFVMAFVSSDQDIEDCIAMHRGSQSAPDGLAGVI